MKLITGCCFIAILCLSNTVLAKDYCETMPRAEKEGDTWFIPESAFTKEAANKAIEKLSSQVNKSVKGMDFQVDNQLKMIKGYLYRAYLAEYEKEFGKEDTALREDFCRFIRNEAFVTH